MATSAERIVDRICGLMPAAGRARRLGTIASSKEILPVGVEADGSPRPVARHLLEAWARAGIDHALVVVRPEKHDIVATLGDGLVVDDGAGFEQDTGRRIDLAYLTVGDTESVPETLDRAYDWLRSLGSDGEGASVALGFPDILIRPTDAWSRLVEAFRASDADAVLGCFPTDQPWKTDMVELDADGRLRDVVIKQRDCTLRWTWSIALWRPSITELLHEIVAGRRPVDRSEAVLAGTEPTGTELFVGDVLRTAVRAGLDVRGLRFEGGSFLDVGTPDDLAKAREVNSPGATSVG